MKRIRNILILCIILLLIYTSLSAAQKKNRGVHITNKSATLNNLYNKSYAVIIGVNTYEKWPSLEYAVRDAQAIEVRLKTLGFQTTILLDQHATRENIMKVLGDDLPKRVEKNDRVLIFFAGHGQTEDLADGSQMGYIIPFDADTRNIFSTAISMDQVRVFSRRLRAKHVLYLMDSCYAGLGLTRSGSIPPNQRDYLKRITTRKAHQMLTAGGKGDQAHEEGGHGLFTKYVLEALDGSADRDGKGFITFSDLGSYVKPKVTHSTHARQVPQYGNIDGEGEFVFVLANLPTEIQVDAIINTDEPRKVAKIKTQRDNLSIIKPQKVPSYHLFDAIKKGDLSKIKRLIEDGADPNALNEYNETPLMVAVGVNTRYACLNIVDLLVLNGADVNMKRRGSGASSGSTALLYAAGNGRTDCVQALIDNNATIDLENANGDTPLIVAVENRHMDTVKLLISKGASLESSSKGVSPLLMASVRGPIEMVQLLVNKGADINYKYQGKSLIDIVKSQGQRDKNKIIDFLKQ